MPKETLFFFPIFLKGVLFEFFPAFQPRLTRGSPVFMSEGFVYHLKNRMSNMS